MPARPWTHRPSRESLPGSPPPPSDGPCAETLQAASAPPRSAEPRIFPPPRFLPATNHLHRQIFAMEVIHETDSDATTRSTRFRCDPRHRSASQAFSGDEGLTRPCPSLAKIFENIGAFPGGRPLPKGKLNGLIYEEPVL